MDTNTAEAIKVFNQGGIVIFPTDTAYGIGCRIDNLKAIKRLYKIRKRPLTMPPPVLFADIQMVNQYVTYIPKEVKENLIDKYWPGALTIILKANLKVVPEIVLKDQAIGVRIPKNKDLQKVIKALGVPILGPSANFHGEKTPYKKSDLDKKLFKLVDFVMEGETSQGLHSTVIDVTTTPFIIIRKGVVKLK